MIDMGFEAEVQFILDRLPVTNLKPDTDDHSNDTLSGHVGNQVVPDFRGKYRQTVMFTAAMPPQVERIARTYMRRPATVVIGTAGQTTDTVEQRVVMVSEQQKKCVVYWIMGGVWEGCLCRYYIVSFSCLHCIMFMFTWL